MSSRCEQLREAALDKGLDSRAGLLWRVHARSCTDCRTELEILQALQRQAVTERCHLGRDDVRLLLNQVREMQQQRNRRPYATRWMLGAAACAVFLLVVGVVGSLSNATRLLPSGAGIRAGAAASSDWSLSIASSGNAMRGVATPPAASTNASSPGASHAASDGVRPPSCEQRIRDLQEQLEERRVRLLHLIESELGDPNGQDAFDLSEAWGNAALA